MALPPGSRNRNAQAMDVLTFLTFVVLLGIGAMLFGVDSRDDRRPCERIGALLPLR